MVADLEQSTQREDGRPVRDFPVAWDHMCETAKVPILLHDFRRSAIRNMIGAGVCREDCYANFWTCGTLGF